MDKIDSTLTELTTWIKIFLEYKITIKRMLKLDLISEKAFKASTLKLDARIFSLRNRRKQIQAGINLIEEA